MASSFTRFLDHTQRRTTVGRTPLDEWSARRRDLYLTTHNTHNRQKPMPLVGFEPTISAGERPQTYALDRAATGTGFYPILLIIKLSILLQFQFVTVDILTSWLVRHFLLIHTTMHLIPLNLRWRINGPISLLPRYTWMALEGEYSTYVSETYNYVSTMCRRS